MTFNDKAEFLRVIQMDAACAPGVEWAKQQEDLDVILRETPINMRLWCIMQGYSQFEDLCPWDDLTEKQWVGILCLRPDLVEVCAAQGGKEKLSKEAKVFISKRNLQAAALLDGAVVPD